MMKDMMKKLKKKALENIVDSPMSIKIMADSPEGLQEGAEMAQKLLKDKGGPLKMLENMDIPKVLKDKKKNKEA